MKFQLNCPGPFLAIPLWCVYCKCIMSIFKAVSTNGCQVAGLNNLARAWKLAENNARLFSGIFWEKKSLLSLTVLKYSLNGLVIFKLEYLHGQITNTKTKQRSCGLFQKPGEDESVISTSLNTGILRKLLPGDIVLADHGFDTAESIGSMQAKLHIPTFTKGKSQVTAIPSPCI